MICLGLIIEYFPEINQWGSIAPTGCVVNSYAADAEQNLQLTSPQGRSWGLAKCVQLYWLPVCWF